MNVAIIGAGPAGSMAAVRLARAGAAVTLFDPSHPREKPCGGGLTGRALALIADLIDIRSLPSVVVRTAVVEHPANAAGYTTADAAEVPLTGRGDGPDASLVVLSRAVFDRTLVDAAVRSGARLIPEKVIDVGRGDTQFVVRTDRGEHRADHIVGADGANSLVRKKLAKPFTRTQLSVAAGFFVHGVTSSAIVIRSMREQPGYLWSFPRPDHLAVGVCAPAAHGVPSPVLRAQSQHWIERHRLDTGATLTPYAWPIPSVGDRDARELVFGGPGWMLVGDAAGLVDPLTREGIYYALLSGQWAAEALFEGASERASHLYADRLHDEVGPEIARAARLSGPFFSPAFSALLVRALRESSAIRDVFVDLVTGVQPYRGLRRRLLATREWALAGRAIRMLLRPGFAGTIRAATLSKAQQQLR
jgi:geranylgeranyl reductase family protein